MPVPATPTILYTSWMSGKIGIDWTDDGTSTSTKIYRATVSGGPYTLLSTGTVSRASDGSVASVAWDVAIGTLPGMFFTDTTTTNGTAYYYTVYNINASGTSAVSNEKSETSQALSSSATYVSQSWPTVVEQGSTWTITGVFTNAGTKVWSEAAFVRLKTVQESPASTAGRLIMSGTASNGQNATFTGTYTFPIVPGTYRYLLRPEVEFVTDFSSDSPWVTVKVIPKRKGQVIVY